MQCAVCIVSTVCMFFCVLIFSGVQNNVHFLDTIQLAVLKSQLPWNFVEGKSGNQLPEMHLVVVTCGADDRVEETLINLKSAVLFSKKIIQFHVFAEDNLHEKFISSLEAWPKRLSDKYRYKVYSISYPDDGKAEEWKKLFKLCASQRLFLPHILKNVDKILYVDTDILFMSPVDEIWEHFERFNSSHLAAMSPEHEQTNVAWYSRFARHPFYGETGVNSGVMLMSLDKVRKSIFKNDLQSHPLTWPELLLPLYKKYKYNITWGDQDLLNIIFHHNPEMLLTFPCHWNYRPDHCMYMPLCKPAAQQGAKVLHGCRRAFHIDKWPAFKAVYSAVKSFDFGDDLSLLVSMMQKNLDETQSTNCQKSSHEMIESLRKLVSQKEEL